MEAKAQKQDILYKKYFTKIKSKSFVYFLPSKTLYVLTSKLLMGEGGPNKQGDGFFQNFLIRRAEGRVFVNFIVSVRGVVAIPK